MGHEGLGLAVLQLPGYVLCSISKPARRRFRRRASYDCAGLFGTTCGSPSPNWRHKLRVTWTSPWDVDVSVDWRHIGSTSYDENTVADRHESAPPRFELRRLPGWQSPLRTASTVRSRAYDYFDVSANWTVREGVELRAGVNNVFDKEPPILASLARPPRRRSRSVRPTRSRNV